MGTDDVTQDNLNDSIGPANNSSVSVPPLTDAQISFVTNVRNQREVLTKLKQLIPPFIADGPEGDVKNDYKRMHEIVFSLWDLDMKAQNSKPPNKLLIALIADLEESNLKDYKERCIMTNPLMIYELTANGSFDKNQGQSFTMVRSSTIPWNDDDKTNLWSPHRLLYLVN